MMRSHSQPRRALADPRGFTLIEIMVVIVILGLLATMVAQNVIPHADAARVQKAAVDVRQIADAARLFFAQKGHVPTLEELTTRDEKGMVYIDNLTKDPWGHAYVLRVGAARGDFAVHSAGPNGVEGDEDDLSSTTPPG